MAECFYHKTTIQDTHRHFRLVIEISRKFPIVCKGLELKKSSLKTEYAWIRSLWMTFSKILQTSNCRSPYVTTKKDYRMHTSELRLHLNCAIDTLCFLHMGYKIYFVQLYTVYLYVNVYIYIYLFIYTFLYICIYIYIYIYNQNHYHIYFLSYIPYMYIYFYRFTSIYWYILII